MIIIKKIKENWLLYSKIILGLIIFGLIIIYFQNIIHLLKELFIFGVILSFAILVVFSLERTIKTGFMGLFILVLCVIYNPNIEKFNSCKEKELYLEYDNIEVYQQSDWLLFTVYDVRFTNTTLKVSENNTDRGERRYIGVLKNFWNLPQEDISTLLVEFKDSLPGRLYNWLDI